MWYKSAKEDSKKHWGYHTIMDINGVDNSKLKDEKLIIDFIKTLVKKIDMIAVGEPVIKYLLEGQPNAGYSVMQLIETSSITCHFVDKHNSMYLDVFSCKSFNPNDVSDLVEEYFEPTKIEKMMIFRDANVLQSWHHKGFEE